MQPAESPRVIAHRGSSRRWPEHTRAAYRQALADGADGLECDVRLTSDRVAVCWHDVDVDRTSDGTGPVHEHTLAQLRRLDVTRDRTGHAAATGPHDVAASGPGEVLTLAELVEIARGAGRPVHLAIELKHPSPYGYAAEDAVLAVLERAGWDPVTGTVGSLSISLMSFHPGSLEHLAGAGRVPGEHLMVLLDEVDVATVAREHAPRRGATLLVAVMLRRLIARARRLAGSGAVGGVGPSISLVRSQPERVREWRAAGRLVRVWTVDERADLDLCRTLGVDEVTTNVPADVLGWLGRDPGGEPAPQRSA
ncbi:MAG TPA: glycerophosphodiester phosphodiesterase family protein [Actinotalea sp.]|nr:glycerophosphodiester phosphodiesterase family protein [Actinotalea sp.]